MKGWFKTRSIPALFPSVTGKWASGEILFTSKAVLKNLLQCHAIKLAAVAELKNSNISSSYRAVWQPRRPQGLLSCRCHIGKQNEKTLGTR